MREWMKRVPERLVAVLKHSGTRSKKRYEERELRLMQWVEKRGLKPTGDPIFKRYNPPFMPWFLRRNEVMIPVERTEN